MTNESIFISLLKKWDNEYHTLRNPSVTDKCYDTMYDWVYSQWPNNDYFKSVGAAPREDLKVKLERVMPHLSKKRPKEALAWALSCGVKVFYITPKLDGISIDITYVKGKLILATTRGNSVVGENVTEHIKCVTGVPHTIRYKKRVIFSGELIIRNSLFKKKYHKDAGGEYKAPRNFVGGQLNADLDKDTRKRLKDIEYLCFGVWVEEENLIGKANALDFANVQGFMTVKDLSKNGAVTLTARALRANEWSDRDFVTLLKGWRSEIPYDQDGLVIEAESLKEKKKLGSLNVKHPQWSYAIKLEVADQDKLVGVVDHVEYNMSLRRLYPPVAILKDGLDFNGADLKRASIYNAETVKDWGIGKGSVVEMIRSGDVIPRIVGVTKKAKPHLPKECHWCKTKLAWTSTGNGLYCPNTQCSGLPYVRLQHFVGCMDIDDVSWGVVDKLYEAGITTPLKLLRVKKKTLMEIDGIGQSVTKQLLSGLKDALDGILLPDLMYASGLFNTPMLGLADKRLWLMCDTLGYDNLVEVVTSSKKINPTRLKRFEAKLLNVKGLGNTTVNLFIDKLPEFKNWLAKLLPHLSIGEPEKPKTGPYTGMSFCFTNFRSAEAEKVIKEGGGKVEGIKKTTTALFYTGSSKKVEAAQAWSIPMYTPEECMSALVDIALKDKNRKK